MGILCNFLEKIIFRVGFEYIFKILSSNFLTIESDFDVNDLCLEANYNCNHFNAYITNHNILQIYIIFINSYIYLI